MKNKTNSYGEDEKEWRKKNISQILNGMENVSLEAYEDEKPIEYSEIS